jgi:hypothetical protein
MYDVSNPIDAFFHVGISPIAQIFIGIGALESINHKGKLGTTVVFVSVFPLTELITVVQA